MGIQTDIEIKVDCQGVTLDTTEAAIFDGAAVEFWGIKSVAWVAPSTGIPGLLRIGAVELDTLDPGAPLGPGDHLFATLVFSLSEPCCICVTPIPCVGCDDPTILVTTLANGYYPVVGGDCFCPPWPVPTLSEWGLILFGLTLLLGIVWNIRRQKVAITG